MRHCMLYKTLAGYNSYLRRSLQCYRGCTASKTNKDTLDFIHKISFHVAFKNPGQKPRVNVFISITIDISDMKRHLLVICFIQMDLSDPSHRLTYSDIATRYLLYHRIFI